MVFKFEDLIRDKIHLLWEINSVSQELYICNIYFPSFNALLAVKAMHISWSMKRITGEKGERATEVTDPSADVRADFGVVRSSFLHVVSGSISLAWNLLPLT